MRKPGRPTAAPTSLGDSILSLHDGASYAYGKPGTTVAARSSRVPPFPSPPAVFDPQH